MSAACIETAIKLIEDHGWIQGSYGNRIQGYCIIGALFTGSESSIAYMAATGIVASVIGNERIVQWNDHYDQTKENVLNTLRVALAKAQEGISA